MKCVGDGVREGGREERGGLSLCLPRSPPLSLFLAHYPLHRQTSPWATVERTVLSHSYRQPQPERCPALLILINTHTHTLSHASQSSSTSTLPGEPLLMDMLVGSRLFLWPPLANETSRPCAQWARDRILEKFYCPQSLFSLRRLVWGHALGGCLS